MHIHKYIAKVLGGERIEMRNGKKVLVKTGGFPIFKCISCPHYIPKEIALGRTALCWRCNRPMEMKSYNVGQKRPKHRECDVIL